MLRDDKKKITSSAKVLKFAMLLDTAFVTPSSF
jgi:hypothetical protein